MPPRKRLWDFEGTRRPTRHGRAPEQIQFQTIWVQRASGYANLLRFYRKPWCPSRTVRWKAEDFAEARSWLRKRPISPCTQQTPNRGAHETRAIPSSWIM
jgi:hypothetical protein